MSARYNPYLPHPAEVVERIEEAPSVITLRVRLRDPALRAAYRFQPGQFNMLYLYGVGEVPISIVSDAQGPTLIVHTIRAVGRVTEGLVRLNSGETLGLRGPYGRGWPIERARGQGLFMVTGGLGCAPTTSAIDYVVQHRADFGPIAIAHGVKRPGDLIYGERFRAWARAQRTQILLAANQGAPGWPGKIGMVTSLLDDVHPDALRGTVMMCGPEVMMRAVAEDVIKRGTHIDNIYVSLERNMQCALGHCGNCQFGKDIVCKNGPVYAYAEVRRLLAVRGY